MTRLAKYLLVLALAAGCAIAPTARIVRAQVEIDAATSAGADRYAIYEIVKAREYLHKAREELGYADYQTSLHYADAAVENGEKAKQMAREHPVEAPTPAPPPAQAPAPLPPRTPPPVIIPVQQTPPSNPQ